TRAQPGSISPHSPPPPGYPRSLTTPNSMVFLGPHRETIVFDPAVPGRSPLIDAVVSPDMVASMLKSIGSLTEIEGTPQLQSVSDLLGHERRVWTAHGKGSFGVRVQVEVMV